MVYVTYCMSTNISHFASFIMKEAQGSLIPQHFFNVFLIRANQCVQMCFSVCVSWLLFLNGA